MHFKYFILASVLMR